MIFFPKVASLWSIWREDLYFFVFVHNIWGIVADSPLFTCIYIFLVSSLLTYIFILKDMKWFYEFKMQLAKLVLKLPSKSKFLSCGAHRDWIY